MAQYGRQTDEFGNPLRQQTTTDQHGDPVVKVYGVPVTEEPLSGGVTGEYGSTQQHQYGSGGRPTGGTGYGTEQQYGTGVGAPVTGHVGATGTTGAEESDPYAATGTTGAYQTHAGGAPPQYEEGGRGLKEKIHDLLPGSGGGDRRDETVFGTEHHEKKGMMEKIKEKLPGHGHDRHY